MCTRCLHLKSLVDGNSRRGARKASDRMDRAKPPQLLHEPDNSLPLHKIMLFELGMDYGLPINHFFLEDVIGTYLHAVFQPRYSFFWSRCVVKSTRSLVWARESPLNLYSGATWCVTSMTENASRNIPPRVRLWASADLPPPPPQQHPQVPASSPQR